MKLKRAVAAILAVAAGVGMLSCTGCKKQESGKIVDENGNELYSYTFNMYIQDDNEYPDESVQTEFDKMLAEKFGIAFDYDRIARTDWETKTNTYFATGDSPDITTGGKEPNYKTWAADGYLAPIDYTKLPNWCALWGDNLEEVVNLASSSDGNLYYLPTMRQEKVQMCWLYRKDVFDKLGLTFPKTTDELLAVCKKLKEAYPSSVIISSNGQKTSSLTGLFQAYWMPELTMSQHSYVDPVTNEFIPYALASDRAREMYKLANTLYAEGLIDKEILSMEKDQFYTRLSQNSAFITYNYVYNTDLFDSKTNVNGNTGTWAWSGDMITAYEDKGTIYKKDPLYSNWGPAFSAELGEDEEKFDAILAYYDWCATEEGQLYNSYGIEGESYEIVDGQPEVLEGWYHPAYATDGKKASAEFGIISNVFLRHPKMFKEYRGDIIEELYAAFTAHDDYYYIEQPVMRYTEEEEIRYNDLTTALGVKRDEYMARFLMGESDPSKDEDWNSYIEDLKKVGLEEFNELQKTVYERTLAELN